MLRSKRNWQSASRLKPMAILSLFVLVICAFVILGGRDVTCGFLVVPEYRDDVANGRTVRLHVAIFASDNPNPAPDPVVSFSGDCPRDITLAFIADPESEPDAACLAAMGSPAFALPAGLSAETVALEP